MRPFEYERAADAADAGASVAGRPGAAFLGGGTNLVDHMKLGVATPDLLVDVSRLPFDTVESLPNGGVRTGGVVRNSDRGAEPVIRERYPVLSQALWRGVRAAAQPRHHRRQPAAAHPLRVLPGRHDAMQQARTGVELFGAAWLHPLSRGLGASEHCVAVHPSDMAVALTARDALVQVQGPDGGRSIPVAELHRLPGDAPERDTVLEHAS